MPFEPVKVVVDRYARAASKTRARIRALKGSRITSAKFLQAVRDARTNDLQDVISSVHTGRRKAALMIALGAKLQDLQRRTAAIPSSSDLYVRVACKRCDADAVEIRPGVWTCPNCQ